MTSDAANPSLDVERREVCVTGIVQGVGFRPGVHRIATDLGLGGTVRNQAGRVVIEVEGPAAVLDRFLELLRLNPPPLARIADIHWVPQVAIGERVFRIQASQQDDSPDIFIPPDAATCDDCLRELFDPTDRRYRYPFINCTHCGPRLTIIHSAPYDRANTTMRHFAMCPACRAEYDDPSDRRFHAQPIACPACGPRLQLLDANAHPLRVEDPIDRVAQALLDGGIVAIKGLGGFHLACDARNGAAVATLRRRKQREEKPFALMVADVGAAEALCSVTIGQQRALLGPERPIVLLKLRGGADRVIAAELAPGNPFLGVMLPYTPLHHLLLRAVGGVPLVMTSGNRRDEPIARDNQDATRRLTGIADLFLTHDRPIRVRCDDSVVRILPSVGTVPLRRSRGYAPRPVSLAFECVPETLAVGGQLKNTFALGRGRYALVSHHLGELDHSEAYRAFERDIELYQQLFASNPRVLAHDLHPDYASTRYALRRADRQGLPLVAVQHHHAHLASCMADNGLIGPVIGVIFDGTGYGRDGAVWGGEVLVGEYGRCTRAAHLRYVGMPGGEAAIRQPWRMAVAHLQDAQCPWTALDLGVPEGDRLTILRMIEHRVNTPMTSSIGRLFDAVAAMVAGRGRVSYEGQAAAELEWLAEQNPEPGPCPPYGCELHQPASEDAAIIMDPRPIIRAVLDDLRARVAPTRIAARFHAALAGMVESTCRTVRDRTGLDRVVLSGGVFVNQHLLTQCHSRLSARGFAVYSHRRVPPNDGGLSLGQIAVASAVHAGAS